MPVSLGAGGAGPSRSGAREAPAGRVGGAGGRAPMGRGFGALMALAGAGPLLEAWEEGRP